MAFTDPHSVLGEWQSLYDEFLNAERAMESAEQSLVLPDPSATPPPEPSMTDLALPNGRQHAIFSAPDVLWSSGEPLAGDIIDAVVDQTLTDDAVAVEEELLSRLGDRPQGAMPQSRWLTSRENRQLSPLGHHQHRVGSTPQSSTAAPGTGNATQSWASRHARKSPYSQPNVAMPGTLPASQQRGHTSGSVAAASPVGPTRSAVGRDTCVRASSPAAVASSSRLPLYRSHSPDYQAVHQHRSAAVRASAPLADPYPASSPAHSSAQPAASARGFRQQRPEPAFALRHTLAMRTSPVRASAPSPSPPRPGRDLSPGPAGSRSSSGRHHTTSSYAALHSQRQGSPPHQLPSAPREELFEALHRGFSPHRLQLLVAANVGAGGRTVRGSHEAPARQSAQQPQRQQPQDAQAQPPHKQRTPQTVAGANRQRGHEADACGRRAAKTDLRPVDAGRRAAAGSFAPPFVAVPSGPGQPPYLSLLASRKNYLQNVHQSQRSDDDGRPAGRSVRRSDGAARAAANGPLRASAPAPTSVRADITRDTGSAAVAAVGLSGGAGNAARRDADKSRHGHTAAPAVAAGGGGAASKSPGPMPQGKQPGAGCSGATNSEDGVVERWEDEGARGAESQGAAMGKQGSPSQAPLLHVPSTSEVHSPDLFISPKAYREYAANTTGISVQHTRTTAAAVPAAAVLPAGDSGFDVRGVRAMQQRLSADLELAAEGIRAAQPWAPGAAALAGSPQRRHPVDLSDEDRAPPYDLPPDAHVSFHDDGPSFTTSSWGMSAPVPGSHGSAPDCPLLPGTRMQGLELDPPRFEDLEDAEFEYYESLAAARAAGGAHSRPVSGAWEPGHSPVAAAERASWPAPGHALQVRVHAWQEGRGGAGAQPYDAAAVALSSSATGGAWRSPDGSNGLWPPDISNLASRPRALETSMEQHQASGAAAAPAAALDVAALTEQLRDMDITSLELIRGYASGYIDGRVQALPQQGQIRSQVVKAAVLQLVDEALIAKRAAAEAAAAAATAITATTAAAAAAAAPAPTTRAAPPGVAPGPPAGTAALRKSRKMSLASFHEELVARIKAAAADAADRGDNEDTDEEGFEGGSEQRQPDPARNAAPMPVASGLAAEPFNAGRIPLPDTTPATATAAAAASLTPVGRTSDHGSGRPSGVLSAGGLATGRSRGQRKRVSWQSDYDSPPDATAPAGVDSDDEALTALLVPPPAPAPAPGALLRAGSWEPWRGAVRLGATAPPPLPLPPKPGNFQLNIVSSSNASSVAAAPAVAGAYVGMTGAASRPPALGAYPSLPVGGSALGGTQRAVGGPVELPQTAPGPVAVDARALVGVPARPAGGSLEPQAADQEASLPRYQPPAAALGSAVEATEQPGPSQTDAAPADLAPVAAVDAGLAEEEEEEVHPHNGGAPAEPLVADMVRSRRSSLAQLIAAQLSDSPAKGEDATVSADCGGGVGAASDATGKQLCPSSDPTGQMPLWDKLRQGLPSFAQPQVLAATAAEEPSEPSPRAEAGGQGSSSGPQQPELETAQSAPATTAAKAAVLQEDGREALPADGGGLAGSEWSSLTNAPSHAEAAASSMTAVDREPDAATAVAAADGAIAPPAGRFGAPAASVPPRPAGPAQESAPLETRAPVPTAPQPEEGPAVSFTSYAALVSAGQARVAAVASGSHPAPSHKDVPGSTPPAARSRASPASPSRRHTNAATSPSPSQPVVASPMLHASAARLPADHPVRKTSASAGGAAAAAGTASPSPNASYSSRSRSGTPTSPARAGRIVLSKPAGAAFASPPLSPASGRPAKLQALSSSSSSSSKRGRAAAVAAAAAGRGADISLPAVMERAAPDTAEPGEAAAPAVVVGPDAPPFLTPMSASAASTEPVAAAAAAPDGGETDAADLAQKLRNESLHFILRLEAAMAAEAAAAAAVRAGFAAAVAAGASGGPMAAMAAEAGAAAAAAGVAAAAAQARLEAAGMAVVGVEATALKGGANEVARSELEAGVVAEVEVAVATPGAGLTAVRPKTDAEHAAAPADSQAAVVVETATPALGWTRKEAPQPAPMPLVAGVVPTAVEAAMTEGVSCVGGEPPKEPLAPAAAPKAFANPVVAVMPHESKALGAGLEDPCDPQALPPLPDGDAALAVVVGVYGNSGGDLGRVSYKSHSTAAAAAVSPIPVVLAPSKSESSPKLPAQAEDSPSSLVSDDHALEPHPPPAEVTSPPGSSLAMPPAYVPAMLPNWPPLSNTSVYAMATDHATASLLGSDATRSSRHPIGLEQLQLQAAALSSDAVANAATGATDGAKGAPEDRCGAGAGIAGQPLPRAQRGHVLDGHDEAQDSRDSQDSLAQPRATIPAGQPKGLRDPAGTEGPESGVSPWPLPVGPYGGWERKAGKPVPGPTAATGAQAGPLDWHLGSRDPGGALPRPAAAVTEEAEEQCDVGHPIAQPTVGAAFCVNLGEPRPAQALDEGAAPAALQRQSVADVAVADVAPARAAARASVDGIKRPVANAPKGVTMAYIRRPGGASPHYATQALGSAITHASETAAAADGANNAAPSSTLSAGSSAPNFSPGPTCALGEGTAVSGAVGPVARDQLHELDRVAAVAGSPRAGAEAVGELAIASAAAQPFSDAAAEGEVPAPTPSPVVSGLSAAAPANAQWSAAEHQSAVEMTASPAAAAFSNSIAGPAGAAPRYHPDAPPSSMPAVVTTPPTAAVESDAASAAAAAAACVLAPTVVSLSATAASAATGAQLPRSGSGLREPPSAASSSPADTPAGSGTCTPSRSRSRDARSIEPVLSELRSVRSAMATGGDPDGSRAVRMAELLGQLDSYRRGVERRHGPSHSIGTQLRILHADMSKWLQTNVAASTAAAADAVVQSPAPSEAVCPPSQPSRPLSKRSDPRELVPAPATAAVQQQAGSAPETSAAVVAPSAGSSENMINPAPLQLAPPPLPPLPPQSPQPSAALSLQQPQALGAVGRESMSSVHTDATFDLTASTGATPRASGHGVGSDYFAFLQHPHPHQQQQKPSPYGMPPSGTVSGTESKIGGAGGTAIQPVVRSPRGLPGSVPPQLGVPGMPQATAAAYAYQASGSPGAAAASGVPGGGHFVSSPTSVSAQSGMGTAGMAMPPGGRQQGVPGMGVAMPQGLGLGPMMGVGATSSNGSGMGMGAGQGQYGAGMVTAAGQAQGVGAGAPAGGGMSLLELANQLNSMTMQQQQQQQQQHQHHHTHSGVAGAFMPGLRGSMGSQQAAASAVASPDTAAAGYQAVSRSGSLVPSLVLSEEATAIAGKASSGGGAAAGALVATGSSRSVSPGPGSDNNTGAVTSPKRKGRSKWGTLFGGKK